MQDETGAFIDLDKEGGFITVRGSSAEAVAAASQRVQDILAEEGGSAGDDASVIEKRITVDRRSISAVIGPGGSTVRDIQDNSGARVSVDRVSECVKAR